MGYRSDVAVAIVIPKHELPRVMALYRLNDNVQEKNAVEYWDIYHGDVDGHAAVMLTFDEQGTKWYPDYPDVKAIEYMVELCQMLGENGKDDDAELRGAGIFVRVGEEIDDTEYSTYMWSDSEFCFGACDMLHDTYYLRRELVIERSYNFVTV